MNLTITTCQTKFSSQKNDFEDFSNNKGTKRSCLRLPTKNQELTSMIREDIRSKSWHRTRRQQIFKQTAMLFEKLLLTAKVLGKKLKFAHIPIHETRYRRVKNANTKQRRHFTFTTSTANSPTFKQLLYARKQYRGRILNANPRLKFFSSRDRF